MAIVRESPPNAHAKGVKGGQRVVPKVAIVRESPPNAHARGMKGVQNLPLLLHPNKKTPAQKAGASNSFLSNIQKAADFFFI
ncbi:hypothetical protein AC622_00410 [Bacillus sp. FJAT-27916]|nr:hypothetical protein AC622_00410 [Bacillus sp. FJAT-27916]